MPLIFGLIIWSASWQHGLLQLSRFSVGAESISPVQHESFPADCVGLQGICPVSDQRRLTSNSHISRLEPRRLVPSRRLLIEDDGKNLESWPSLRTMFNFPILLHATRRISDCVGPTLFSDSRMIARWAVAVHGSFFCSCYPESSG